LEGKADEVAKCDSRSADARALPHDETVSVGEMESKSVPR
jgi:hypothetical protein